MEKLINILKTTLSSHRITDIIQTGPRELDIIVSTKEDAKSIRNMAELIHEDSEVKIKDITINFVDQYGTRFERF
ncbi:MAG: hypothetical protein EOO92_23955 [Pedobacter sp.]|nr:MAG: hypothetical protein EOO92_23955 [Pedobacter sp.]